MKITDLLKPVSIQLNVATNDDFVFGIMDDGRYGYTIKTCPFYSWRKIKDLKPLPWYLNSNDLGEFGEDTVGWCKLIKGEIDDQCKNCGLKYGK